MAVTFSSSDLGQGPVPRGMRDPLLRRYGATVLAALPPLVGLIWALGGAAPGLGLGLGGYGLLALLALRGLQRDYPHARLGLCNVVTHLRATLAMALLAVIPVAGPRAGDPALWWAVAAIALIALCSDGIDGWAARRAGLASRFGARFDMEVDSLLALVLAALVVAQGTLGAWALLLGLMRYLFLAAMVVFPWINRPTPPRFSSKLVCVLQILALIVLVTPVVTGPVAHAIALVALALLIWSFGFDLRYLWQRRHR